MPRRGGSALALALLACGAQATLDAGSETALRGTAEESGINSKARVRVGQKGRFIDGFGRTRIFHGVNAVSKSYPWLPQAGAFDHEKSLNAEDMLILRKWGFNMVRLGVMWPGVEPVKGQIDQGYLDQALNMSAMLAEQGIYTLVDFHQDLGSRRYCGEGFPEHYVDEMLQDSNSKLSGARPFPWPLSLKPMAVNSSGYPDLKDCLSRQFASYYFSEKVGTLFNELYTPGTSLHEGALNYWEVVTRTFRGKPQVLGYELLNEPNGFCLDGATSCLKAREFVDHSFEDKILTPFYQAVAARIRKLDRSTPIFYEPSPIPKLSGMPSFGTRVLGNDTQQVLAYHSYCMPGEPGPFDKASCLLVQNVEMGSNIGYQKANPGVGGFLTEFGAIGEGPGELRQIQRLLEMADDGLQSWAYWQLKLYGDITTENDQESFYDSNGQIHQQKLRLLSRTYAQAIAGDPTRMFFDAETGFFDLEFTASARQSAPTEIYLNEDIYYPSGFNAQVTPASCFEVKRPRKNYLHLVVPKDAAWHCAGVAVRFNITVTSTSLIV